MNAIVLAVLLAVVQASPPVPRQTADNAAAGSQHVQQNTQNDQSQTNTQSAPTLQNQAKQDQGERQNPADDNAQKTVVIPEEAAVPKGSIDRWRHLDTIFTGLLVLIGAIGIYWAIKTVKATEVAARAALLNAQAVIYTERPWLLIEQKEIKPRIELEFVITDLPPTDRDKHTTCVFWIKNYGRTPAIVVAQKAELQIGTHGLKLPAPAFFDSSDPIIPYIFPQDITNPQFATLAATLTTADKVLIKTQTKFVWLCGYIRYKDAVPRTDTITYETRFCYVWWENDAASGWMIGPELYNKSNDHPPQKI